MVALQTAAGLRLEQAQPLDAAYEHDSRAPVTTTQQGTDFDDLREQESGRVVRYGRQGVTDERIETGNRL